MRLFFAGLVMLIAAAAQSAEIQSLRLVDSPERLTIVVRSEGDLQQELPDVEFIGETIQFDLPGSTVKGGEIRQTVSDTRIRSLYAYQLEPETARIRILLNKGVKAENFKSTLTLQVGPQGMEARIQKPALRRPASTVAVTLKPKDIGSESVVKPAQDDLSQLSDSEIESQLRTMVPPASESSVSGTAASNTSSAEATQKAAADKETSAATDSATSSASAPSAQKEESQIPVFSQAAKKASPSGEVSTVRTILGLALVAVVLFTFYAGAKKFLDRKNKSNPHTSIRVVTQHYLGPKKSLAIVSVAGESILIGITDHNISMIKSLSLLDGEVPEALPENFQSSLAQAEEQDGGEDDYSVKGIKEIVAGRLKGMRDLL